MEKEIAKYFAEMLLKDQIDQWGNIQRSPVRQAIDRYVADNKEKFLEEVIKVLTVEKIAESMSGQLLDIAKKIYGSNYQRESIVENLKSKVAEFMAKKISEDLKI